MTPPKLRSNQRRPKMTPIKTSTYLSAECDGCHRCKSDEIWKVGTQTEISPYIRYEMFLEDRGYKVENHKLLCPECQEKLRTAEKIKKGKKYYTRDSSYS